MEELAAAPRRRALACAALAVATLLLYAPVRALPYLHYDDVRYVTQNPPVQAGLEPWSVSWAFTSFHASNWHPLTWLSHMLDVDLFGASPVGPHVENALFHAANAVLVFLLLVQLTGAGGRSLAVAALFAFHPQRVESVAWVSERKDVLATCFALVSLLAWTRFARSGSRRGYRVALGAMALGLLAKPTPVVLPLLFSVLDYWPLRRGFRLREKLPFFALALASCVVTMLAQTRAMQPDLTPFARGANALVALALSLEQALWPWDLAVPYLHPIHFPTQQLLVSAAVAAVAAGSAFALLQRAPYVAAGFAWFALALGPTLGIVPVGFQITADRYTYLPYVGLAWALVFAAADACARLRAPRWLAPAAAVALVLVFAVVTRAQLTYWRSDLALFGRALHVTTGNWYAHTEVGVELAALGRLDDALTELSTAVRLAPGYERAQANYAFTLFRARRYDQAIDHFARALSIDPSTGGPGERHLYLALALEQMGRLDEAVGEYQIQLELRPGDPRASEALQRLLGLP